MFPTLVLYSECRSFQGPESISDYSITFHYVSPEKMQALEFFIYHLQPYGIVSGFQKLNKPHAQPTLSPEVKSQSKSWYTLAQWQDTDIISPFPSPSPPHPHPQDSSNYSISLHCTFLFAYAITICQFVRATWSKSNSLKSIWWHMVNVTEGEIRTQSA